MGFSFGSYYPAQSVAHRMDPRAKLLFGFAFIVVILFARSFAALGALAAVVLAMFCSSMIPVGKVVRSVAPLMFIVVIASLTNLFWVQGGAVLAQWGPITISEEGAYQCGFIALRLVLMMLVMCLVTLTTTTLDLTEASEHLMAPLARFGFPAHELSMILGIALRFMPQFATELVNIYHAQISRGAKSISGPVGAVRTLSALFIPLFSSAFRHAETLSEAMDARCYHGAPGRTRLHPLKFSSIDVLLPIMLGVCILAVIAL